jgi:hypothetical protein
MWKVSLRMRVSLPLDRLAVSGGATRAVVLAVLATLQMGMSAALTARPAAQATQVTGRTVAVADRPLTEALLGAVSAAAPAPSAVAPARAAVPHATVPATKIGKPLAPHDRYVPSGTGMWTYQWAETEGGSTRKIVKRAEAMGLTHLYVRTGTRKGGFDGGPVLRKLLPATKGTDLKVIAWDFPQLKNPVADAKRLARAANYIVPGAPRVAAVAPDIETGAEGTKISSGAVTTYMTTLRRLIPKRVAIIGVTPWPSEHRVGKYPFAHVAKYSDALAPMAYWINRDPATVTRQSMKRLSRFGKPVLPIGQAYDPRIDVPGIGYGPPSRAQVKAFFDTAAKLGAPSASLRVGQFASTGQWQALRTAHKQFPAHL